MMSCSPGAPPALLRVGAQSGYACADPSAQREALATLATHELGMMRADFVHFPADAEHANARRISVGPHAHLRWRFQGVHQEAPMHAIAGARIVVTDIVLSEGA